MRFLKLNELPLEQSSHELSVESNGANDKCHQHADVEFIVSQSGDGSVGLFNRVQFHPPDQLVEVLDSESERSVAFDDAGDGRLRRLVIAGVYKQSLFFPPCFSISVMAVSMRRNSANALFAGFSSVCSGSCARRRFISWRNS